MPHPALRCIEFVEVASDWMDGGLDDDHREQFEEHVSLCPHCCRYLEQTRAAVQALSADVLVDDIEHGGDAPSAPMRAALLDAFRASRTPG